MIWPQKPGGARPPGGNHIRRVELMTSTLSSSQAVVHVTLGGGGLLGSGSQRVPCCVHVLPHPPPPNWTLG